MPFLAKPRRRNSSASGRKNYMKLGLLLILFGGAALGQTANCPNHQFAWSHVYNPSRLTVEEPCVAVTGIIVDATNHKNKDGVRHEKDGDSHGWLRLDQGQEKYLNAGNKTHEGGNLVFEVQCLYPVTQADAKAACAGWKNPIKIPAVGTHIRITGSWIMDDNHAQWFEVHPVESIIIIK